METASEPIIEIKDLVLGHSGRPDPVEPSELVIHRGDVVGIVSDDTLSSRHLLRVLATLDRPRQGEYRFKGRRIDLKSYVQCLAVKRRIGYVAADAALISNRTLRENLLLMRFYHENDLRIQLDQTVRNLCEDAGLTHKLDQRPAALSDTEQLKAVAIREFAKTPSVMLIELPEHFMQMTQGDGLFQHLNESMRTDRAVVFLSNSSKLTGLANRRLALAGGTIRMT